MNIPSTPKPVNITFLDRAIVQIQDRLKEKLSWLDHSFGISQRLVTKRDMKDFFYPGVHIGKGTYINVLPDQGLGNFSFIILRDPQSISHTPGTYTKIQSNIGIVFWFDLKNLFPSSDDRNIEVVKRQILDVLTKQLFLTTGSLGPVIEISQNAENVYKGYSLKEVDSQFLMQPYAGLRFDCNLFITEEC